ncbi:type I polyketide synthase [Umezawaea endophytica]|uniref:SDR family NAD(P)-dependent oxidoreductase n=1 Tax=Umezawaea endophytica TaxID=1654476 RepID=A0A9X2VUG6_9PSEU|nr:type I polyketide synthase [Umezawaea endophytica]MCS7483115.1 SDR family NAD(P)-dependent oxidoreductase [Umezawaea endophytica]
MTNDVRRPSGTGTSQDTMDSRHDPVVIVGTACRLPGGVSTPAEFWRLLVDGGDVFGPFPDDRGWDVAGIYDPDPGKPGRTYVRRGGFLDDVAGFDADFFGISPREAEAMHPQQRLLLEEAWNLLERVGVDPTRVRGSAVGVFIGSENHQYGPGTTNADGGAEGHLHTGTAASVNSGRLAFQLGLRGPVMTVDTASSGAMVALHLAARSLRHGECRQAIVGGVAVMPTPGPFLAFSRQGALAPDGRCKPFSADADGTAWSEGVGLLLVERLSYAREQSHEVLAVLRGSAVNHDGASPSLTAPSGAAQEQVIRDALADAGLRPSDVDAVEAHGTGTRVGDPVEVAALQAVYGDGRTADDPLWIGSVKSNVGHTQGASGVVGVIKMVEALRRGVLPRTLHVASPTPEVDWTSGGVALLAEQRDWADDDGPRRCGVSSFGISGTNAHVVLEQAPAVEPAAPTGGGPAVVPWVLSAKSAAAVREQAANLVSWLAERPEPGAVDVGRSLVADRTSFDHRLVVVGRDRDELTSRLRAAAEGLPGLGVVGGAGPAADSREVVMVFAGQGSQWAGMGSALLDTSPVFADWVSRCDKALAPFVDWSLVDVLRGAPGAPALEGDEVVQPALWAVMISLARMWQSLGVRPSAVVGHSQGEMAAACVAGALSLEDGARIVCLRSRIVARELAGKGGLLSVTASRARVDGMLARWDGLLSVAAVNGPANVVVAGDLEALAELAARCETEGVRAKRVPIDYASHSAQMEAVRDELLAGLAGLSPRTGEIPFMSTVEADWVDTARLDADYWYRNLRHTVRFEPAVRLLLESGHDLFLESSPHPVLTISVEDTIGDVGADAVSVGTLRRDDGDLDRVLTGLGALFAAGVPVDWTAVFDGAGTRVELPTYAFQRGRFWMDASPVGSGDRPGVGHPWLGAVVPLAGSEVVVLTGRLSLADQPWLAEHTVLGRPVFPGTGFVELALRAGREAGLDRIDWLDLTAPLVLPDQDALVVQVRIDGVNSHDRRRVDIHSRPESAPDWTHHATGALSVDEDEAAPGSSGAWPPVGAEPVEFTSRYPRLAEAGLTVGPAYRGIRSLWRRGGEVFAELVLPERTRSSAFDLHPALLETAPRAWSFATADDAEAVPYPKSWADVVLHAVGSPVLRVTMTDTGADSTSLVATDDQGVPVVSVGAFETRPVAAEALVDVGAIPGALFGVDWVPVEPALRDPASVPVVLGADALGLADVLRDNGVWAITATSASDLPVDAEPIDVLMCVIGGEQDPASARATTEAALDVVRLCLDRNDSDRLTVVTRGAHTGQDLAAGAVWGALVAVQASHPGRVRLVDLDNSEDAVPLHALGADEPRLAVRDGRLLVPVLSRVTAGRTPIDWSPQGTVLVAGNPQGAAGRLAKHLEAGHGMRRVVLHDPLDGAAVRDVVAAEHAEGPLTAVVVAPDHADRSSWDDAALAWALHEATLDIGLRAFVLSSSAATVLGGAAVLGGTAGTEVAAGAYLSSLAQRRNALGLTATALAWGTSAEGLAETDRAALIRAGLAPLTDEQVLPLFDAAVTVDRPVVIPMAVDLRAVLARGDVPPLFRGLVEPKGQEPEVDEPQPVTTTRFAHLPVDGRHRAVLDLVLAESAVVLGRSDADRLDRTREFRKLGFDSLSGVELRHRLVAALEVDLPTSLIYDHPTPERLAEFLSDRLFGESDATGTTAPPGPADAGEPIAIVGMACRFPGGISSPEDLWQLVVSGRHVISDFPTDRGWDLEGLFSGASSTRSGGFLDDIAVFDSDFFGISPREAMAMDPQQRLLLETSWEALERSGIAPSSVRGTQAGVFIGTFGSGYASLVADRDDAQGFVMTGTTPSVLSGRLSYFLGLEGPAVTVDTACSSSLVALHWAEQALRTGECSLALAGGATVMSTADTFVEFSRQGGLSSDGRCKAFSDSADGTGWSEGVGVLVLERLSDAERLGHRVLAVVRGSAVNQDGASNGLTAPNGPSQQRVIRQALASAGLSPSEVDVVEAHGTGTKLGDPIEAQALLATYGQDRDRPLLLGSVKSNIGHSQGAAGVAGVIKMVMAMQNELLPKTLHVTEPSSHVDWSAGAVELLTEQVKWPATGKPRRAAVSSFGVSGTNAHVVLEQARAVGARPVRTSTDPVPWVLSGKSAAAVREQAGNLVSWLADRPDVRPVDVGHSLVSTRSLFDHRVVVVGGGRDELVAGLGAAAVGASAPGVVSGERGEGEQKVVFLFPGQGSQWVGMGVALLDASPVFAESIARCAEALVPFVGWSLVDVLRGVEGAPLLAGDDVVQPVLWAVMVSLAVVWRSWGVVPAAVVGHSQGEIAAACVAGALSLEDGARIVCLRSRLVANELSGQGGMVSVTASRADVEARLAEWDGRLSVAAVNGPSNVVVSGEVDALEELVDSCVGDGVRAKKVAVAYASHSAQMEQLEGAILDGLAVLRPRSSEVPFLSTVTGDWLDTSTMDAGYWFRNLRETVQLETALRVLLESGHSVFLESSPHPILTVGVEDTIEDAGADAVLVGSLRRDDGGLDRVLAGLGSLFVAGVPVDWASVFGGAGVRVDLPTYAFQHERYWPDPTAGVGLTLTSVDVADGLGTVVSGELSIRQLPWLVDHVVAGRVFFPGTGFVELVTRAADEVGCDRIEELTLTAPLVLPADGVVPVQVWLGPADESGRHEFGVFSRGADDEWVRHAGGAVVAGATTVDTAFAAGQWPPRDAEPVPIEGFYEEIVDAGLAYGPMFRGLVEVWQRGDEVFAETALPDAIQDQAGAYGLHPALFDAVLHPVFIADLGVEPGALPFSWEGVSLHATGASSLRVRMTRTGDTVSIVAADHTGAPVVAVESLSMRLMSADRTTGSGQARDSLFAVDWTFVRPETTADLGVPIVLGPDVLGVGAGLRASNVTFGEAADLAALREGGAVPKVVITSVAGDHDVVASTHRSTGDLLEVLQQWLANEELADSRLVLVSRGAVSGDDLVASAAWGLVRSAQVENPDRFVLVDWDGGDLPLAAVLGSGESQVLLAEGEIRVGRLGRMSGVDPEPHLGWDPDGTVLVTGGTGGLGGALARHLVVEHGMRNLLLLSRSGPAAPGATGLVADLEAHGASVEVAKCDTADRDEVAAVLARIPADRPLTAVVHTAGVLDDGVVESMTRDRVSGVLRPKVDGGWHLHELTRGTPLRGFVVFSSVVGVMGNGGQSGYGAGNAFLDGLVAKRRAAGLPGVSLAWGVWDSGTGMTGSLLDRDLARLGRDGVGVLSVPDGLGLFDVAVGSGAVTAVPVRWDWTALRSRLVVPCVLRGLLGVRRRAVGGGSPGTAPEGLAGRLRGLGPEEARSAVMAVVRSEVGVVLGLGAAGVEMGREFRKLGFDSLLGVELRNRLGVVTGLRLPATLVYDHPSPEAVADYIIEDVTAGDPTVRPGSPLDELDRLERALNAAPPQEDEHKAIADRLEVLALRFRQPMRSTAARSEDEIKSSSVGELLDLIDQEFGPA